MKKKTLNSNFLSISLYIFQPEVMLILCMYFEEFQPTYTYAIKVMFIKKWLFQVLQMLSCCASNNMATLINQKGSSPNYSSAINLTILLKTRKQYFSPKFKILHLTILHWNASRVELKALTFLDSIQVCSFIDSESFSFG